MTDSHITKHQGKITCTTLLLLLKYIDISNSIVQTLMFGREVIAGSSCQHSIARCEAANECRWHLGELRVRCASSSCRRTECAAFLVIVLNQILICDSILAVTATFCEIRAILIGGIDDVLPLLSRRFSMCTTATKFDEMAHTVSFNDFTRAGNHLSKMPIFDFINCDNVHRSYAKVQPRLSMSLFCRIDLLDTRVITFMSTFTEKDYVNIVLFKLTTSVLRDEHL
ncbi:hypothetical protein DICVIV_07566 [Dictyocaulus viviparus]|uniref:Uncharacterized protein n=1 Tax=Dictyocaulus viviparus TaxID=29172 RepID=A0A0D8XVH7_DICVI|nr:hypothetical protein DICVIV_07566 [Dictyocaulus viviparus]